MRKRLDSGSTPAMARRRQAFPAAWHRAARRSPRGAARVAAGCRPGHGRRRRLDTCGRRGHKQRPESGRLRCPANGSLTCVVCSE